MIHFIKSCFWIPALIALLLYSQVLGFGTAWGDDILVISPFGKDLSLALEGFYKNVPGHHFIPLYFFQSYLVNSIFGEKAYPFGFHVYQLLLNITSCILAPLVFYKITNNKLVSILMVTIWIVHPINVEVLTRVGTTVCELSAGTFCLAFIYLFIKIRETEKNILKLLFSFLGILCFLASVTSCEQHFFFPFVLLLIYFYLERTNLFLKKDLLGFVVFPLILACPFYLVWRYIANGGTLLYTGDELITWTEFGTPKDILFRAFWLAPQLFVHYLRLFFYPNYLSEAQADWYKVGESVWSFYSILCQVFVLILILSAMYLFKKIPLFAIGIFWFFASMILVIQIIPCFSIVDEHYCYISLFGILLSLFSFVIYYFKTIPSKVIVSAVILIFSLFTWRTILYIPSGKDALTQHVYLSTHSPKWIKLKHALHTYIYAKENNRINELPNWINEKSIEKASQDWLKDYNYITPNLSHKFGPYRFPYNYRFYFIFAESLINLNSLKEAQALIKQALLIRGDGYAWWQLTSIFYNQENWHETLAIMKKAIELNPRFKEFYSQALINVLLNTKRFDEGEVLVKNYIKASPKSSHPFLFAGLFYKAFNKPKEAINYFERAILKDKIVSVNHKDLYIDGAKLFIQERMLDKAKEALYIVKRYDPFNEEAKEILSQVEHTLAAF